MAKTRDDIRTDMTIYLGAAKKAMGLVGILEGNDRRGVEIVRLACSFRKADVTEGVVQHQVGEQKRKEAARKRAAEERAQTSEY